MENYSELGPAPHTDDDDKDNNPKTTVDTPDPDSSNKIETDSHTVLNPTSSIPKQRDSEETSLSCKCRNKSSECQNDCETIRQHLKYVSEKLSYLNGSHATLIFTAMERLIRDWEALHRELTRMEGLLARNELVAADPHIFDCCRVAIDTFRKASRRVDAVTNAAIVVESISGRAEYTIRVLNGKGHRKKGHHRGVVNQAQEVVNFDNRKSRFPLTIQLQKVSREFVRRTEKWTIEFNRRIDEVMAV